MDAKSVKVLDNLFTPMVCLCLELAGNIWDEIIRQKCGLFTQISTRLRNKLKFTPLTLIVELEGTSANDLNYQQIGSGSCKLTLLKRAYELLNESVHERVETFSDSVSKTLVDSCATNVGFEWTEPRTTTKMYSVVSIWPSDVLEGMFSVSVSKNWLSLLPRIDWPKALRET